MSSIEPTTGTPTMERPWARLSSSNTATGTRPAPGLRSISRMAAAPASRLPTTATRRPTRLAPRCQANSREWKRRTPMPIGGEHASHHDDGDRDVLESVPLAHRVQHHQDAHHHGGRQDQLAGLLNAGVAPHPAVQPEDVVGHQRDDQGHGQEGGQVLPVQPWGLVPEVGDLGQAVPGDDTDGVEQGEHQTGPDPAGPDGHVPLASVERRIGGTPHEPAAPPRFAPESFARIRSVHPTAPTWPKVPTALHPSALPSNCTPPMPSVPANRLRSCPNLPLLLCDTHPP